MAANVRYCARDRQRHRALTFLSQALRLAVNIDEPFADAIRAAMRRGDEMGA